MKWPGRRRGGRVAAGVDDWFAEFVTTRIGVEGYVEPQTNVTETTLVLVAADGEWTRRRVPDPAAAHAIGRRLSFPVYDVHLTGYPARMREWTSRQRKSGPGGPPAG